MCVDFICDCVTILDDHVSAGAGVVVSWARAGGGGRSVGVSVGECLGFTATWARGEFTVAPTIHPPKFVLVIIKHRAK